MSNYDNTNSGALFRNDRKESDKHPDYRGELNVGGVEYWVSAWLKTSGKGTKFMSLAVTPKDEKPSKPAKQAEKRLDDDQDVPF
jgi:uncharacterized protein (DUF736 family)